VTSISKNFGEYDLRSYETIEALKSSNQALIDQIASKIYSNILSVANAGIQEHEEWPGQDEKLKSVLHTLVAVFGAILKIEDLPEQVTGGKYEDHKLITELAYELNFLLLDLLGLYYEFNYSTWNLINLFNPDDLTGQQLQLFLEPAVKPPSELDPITAHEDNTNLSVLKQALTNWIHWCHVYKKLMIDTYDTNTDEIMVAFHSLLGVSAYLIGTSHIASLLLFSRARAVTRLLGGR
jgi:hypothetical protein